MYGHNAGQPVSSLYGHNAGQPVPSLYTKCNTTVLSDYLGILPTGQGVTSLLKVLPVVSLMFCQIDTFSMYVLADLCNTHNVQGELSMMQSDIINEYH